VRAAGIDVGLRRLHAVVIDGAGEILEASVLAAGALPAADAVAIDAPESWNQGRHRRGRCAEIAASVPWPAPAQPQEGWMAVGIDLFRRLRAAAVPALEVYPYAGFRRLAASRPPRKTTAEGRAARLALLEAAGLRRAAQLPGHHFLDAALAALIARDYLAGRATALSHAGLPCDDGSRIWLPRLHDLLDLGGGVAGDRDHALG
jgi:predicted nuclease with RNAse H fold